MRRALSALAACAWLVAGCQGPVESGQAALTQGCGQDSDCPVTYLCNGGACEQWVCSSSCDCPSPNTGFGCVDGGLAPNQFPGGRSALTYCARGATPAFPDAGCGGGQ